jgi:type VI secretion system secreted protein VgrG
MAFQEERKFFFRSQALPEDTFDVVSFEGFEGISKLYEFRITLVSEIADIDIKQVLRSPASFSIMHDDKEIRFQGILSYFEQLHEVDRFVYFKTALVPRLWLSNLNHENQIFLDKSVPEIIEEILKQAGLTARDYTFKLTGDYRQWEYICQYRETDYNFISRWMEREGIYFYFDQTDEGEKLIITDTNTAHQDIPYDSEIYYSPPSALVPTEEEGIRSFVCRQKRLPKRVVLKDYNYRKPSLEIRGEAMVDPESTGEVYLYGEHFKTPEEGDALAKIRAQELICRERLFIGESTCPSLRPGYLFKLEDHYREDFNQKYLVLEIEHRGSQSALFLAGLDEELSEQEEQLSYSNTFIAIPADVQFRPERKTEKPRFHGTMHAKVDAAGDGQYAEIDKWGRYKVRLPFDLKNPGDGKASRWIRMAQPYAGAGCGMHFPLHKGTEVLLTFVDGDPDRPIISSAVPNPETSSPVTEENSTKNAIVTSKENNFILMEDQEGKNRIILKANESSLKIGAANDDEITAETSGSFSAFSGDKQALTAKSSTEIITGEPLYKTIDSYAEAIKGALTKPAGDIPFVGGIIVSRIESVVNSAATRIKNELNAEEAVTGASIENLDPGISMGCLPDFSYIRMEKGKTDLAIGAKGGMGLFSEKGIGIFAKKQVEIGSNGKKVSLNYDPNNHIILDKKQIEIKDHDSQILVRKNGNATIEAKQSILCRTKEQESLISLNKSGATKIHNKKSCEIRSGQSVDIKLKDNTSKIRLEKRKISQEANSTISMKAGKSTLKMDKNNIVSEAQRKIQHKVKNSHIRITTQLKLKSGSKMSLSAQWELRLHGATAKISAQKIDLG